MTCPVNGRNNLLDENASALKESPARASVSLVLQELREATAENHRGLERRLPFTSSELDIHLYKRLIRAYYGFYVSLEHQLDCANWAQLAGEDRHKAGALRNDLRALGMTDIEIETLGLCSELPPLNTHAQVMGALYVIEGATLGGQILRRIAHDKLAVGEGTGGDFLDVYGSATGRMWKAYLAELSQIVVPDERKQVVSTALAIFVCFERWLEHSQVLLQDATSS